ncbi:hypothetical protein GF362_05895 [Candidatus Dojkabacteria bacterium]|nr:hypothetical protein [Candidatus Dojkabacteria bacterium]
MITSYALISKILVFFINVLGISLTITVVASRAKKRLKTIFSIMTFLMFIWVDFAFQARLAEQSELALDFIRIAWSITPFLFILIYTFIILFLEQERKHRILTSILYFIGFIFLVITLFTDFIISDILFEDGILNIVYGDLVWFFFGIVAVLTVINFYLLFKEYNKDKLSIEKKKNIQYLLWGLTFFFAMNAIFNIALPVFFRIVHLYEFGDYSTIIFLSIIAFIIVQRNLLGIKVMGSAFIVSFLGSFLLLDTLLYSSSLDQRLSKLLILLIYVPFAYFLIQSVLNEIRQRELLAKSNRELSARNHELDTLFRITNEIVTTLDAKVVAQRASNLVAEEMGYIGAAIISKNKTTTRNEFLSLTEHNVRDKIFNFMMEEEYQCSTDHRSKYKDIPINENNFVISESLDEALPILMPDEDQAKEIQKLLGIRLIINAPIKVQNEIIGLVSFFLAKESEEEITSREFDMMQTFAFQVGIGLENARLFKELEELSKTLAEKNLQLEEYAKKEKDILDIMGHELRTPITIVRNSLAFLKTLAKRGEVKPGKLNHYIDVALRSARREINIIETMLSATKVEGGKIEIFRTKVDSKDVIDEAVIGQRENIKAKDLELNLEIPENIPPIYADRSRVQEIIDNFLSNAVKYTKEGSVTIKAEEKGSSVQFSIIDTGYGMTDEQIERLGTKFYRVKQHVNDDKQRLYNVVRPGGTGLGLYVTFNLVKLHGGKVEVESEEGKGSTFKFTIPKYIGQESEVDDAKSKDLLQEYRKKRKGDQVSDQ